MELLSPNARRFVGRSYIPALLAGKLKADWVWRGADHYQHKHSIAPKRPSGCDIQDLTNMQEISERKHHVACRVGSQPRFFQAKYHVSIQATLDLSPMSIMRILTWTCAAHAWLRIS